MSTFKLHYFDLKGRAEMARLLFAYAKVKYEDVRIDRAKWPELKESAPGGTVPYLEVDGQGFGQSMALNRYLARKFGLMGSDEISGLAIDEFVEDVVECRSAMIAVFFEKDEARKATMGKKLKEETLPNFMKKCEAKLTKNGTGWVIGKSLTFADIVLFDGFDMFFSGPEGAPMLPKLPQIAAHRTRVSTIPQIKAWLDVRPKTSM
ncbi:hematopoietic prostaglandin D synthase-like [Mizuhopecten yessoensis]|uniref:S-crystallin SL11 n=1 Tax=Mizuhopecten yessoensis TaxID=6573 RepID=A0A210PWE5_MIZYE|nr:hematopoietic prostaglandin D synthase-like [Mizuhopecten yessoensis]OWF40795.1 S-crystallin SL11 [Mizuhopecten yessoensis]